MKPLKKLPKDLKIFFFLVAARNELKGVPLELFRHNIKDLEFYENTRKFDNIHKKLENRQIISPDELEFMIEYERKRRWEKM